MPSNRLRDAPLAIIHAKHYDVVQVDLKGQLMGHSTESRERDALFAQLQNEAASLDTIHEMLGSGK